MRPTQNAMDRKKILNIIASTKPMDPVITTREYYILDGHHRWAAAHETQQPLTAHVLDMSHDQALDFLIDKDYAHIPEMMSEALDIFMTALSLHPKFKIAYHFYKGLVAKDGPSDNAKSRAARVAGVEPMMFSKFVSHKERLEKAAQPAGAKK